MAEEQYMETNIFQDFETKREYTIELLDGISSGVSLFMVSDEFKFLHFNRAADEQFGYEKGGLLSLTQQDPLSIFHPDYVDRLYGEIIATMRGGRLFNYNCRIICCDGSYKWTNLSAELVQQKDGGRLYFYGVLSPIETPRNTLLEGCHFLIAAGREANRRILAEEVEEMGGTCSASANGLEALDSFNALAAGTYRAIFIGAHLAGLNGLELAKEIRLSGHPDSAAVPLVLIVSQADEDTIHAAAELGINLILKEPLSHTDLRSLLTELLTH